jgi:hypothetical protein
MFDHVNEMLQKRDDFVEAVTQLGLLKRPIVLFGMLSLYLHVLHTCHKETKKDRLILRETSLLHLEMDRSEWT